VLVLALGYLFYTNYYVKEYKTIWDFVPENALMVYDIPDVGKVHGTALISDFGMGIANMDLWTAVKQAFIEVDTSKYNSAFFAKLGQAHVLTSLHAVASEQADLLILINSSVGNSQLMQQYIDDLIRVTNAKLTQRVYNDRNIFEVAGDALTFSFFIEDHTLAISQTPFLIEDAIRTISSSEEGSFRKSHRQSINANKLKNDQGDLYINTGALNSFFKSFTSEINIDGLANSTFMDVKLENDLIALSGFTYAEDSTLLSTLNGQAPIEIAINGYVPNTAYSVLHTGISVADEWYKAYRRQQGLNSPMNDWDAERMTQWLGKELALINLKIIQEDTSGKIILIETNDINGALNQLNTLGEIVTENSLDTLFYENYGDVLIKELAVPEFPEKLFGKTYTGFTISYYAIIDNYVVLTNGLDVMHHLINSIAEEDTWGRNLDKNQWLSQTLEEASLSYFFDYKQAIPAIREAVNETWNKRLQSNEQVMKGVGMGAIQFSNIDGQFYTSMMLTYDAEKSIPESLNFHVENTTYLEENAITKPFVVRNHKLPKIREVVIQDSLKNIYLIADNGAIVWKDSIGESIVGNVNQIDFYKNRKLQYLFATAHKVHLIDRNGFDVEQFPLSMDFEISYVSVIDYDHTKNYRILLTDKKGNLYMYDQEGRILEGWNPRIMSKPLTAPARHIRVRGKDVIVALQSNGEVHVLNRRGESMAGFPVKLENIISGDVHISKGRDFDHTIFSMISEDGEMIQFDLNGDIVNKKQFYKPTKDTVFELVLGITGSDFVVTRQNAFRLSILNMEEEVLVEKDYLLGDSRKLQYYDLGGDDKAYVVNDFVQGFGYIYNHKGELLNNIPINNQKEIGLLINSAKNKTYIYSTYQDQVNVYSY
jgi:hypothetical protein